MRIIVIGAPVVVLSILTSCSLALPKSRAVDLLSKNDDLIVSNSETNPEGPHKVHKGVVEFKYVLLIKNTSKSASYLLDTGSSQLIIDGKVQNESKPSCKETIPGEIAPLGVARINCQGQVRANAENKLMFREINSVVQIPYSSKSISKAGNIESIYQLKSEDFE